MPERANGWLNRIFWGEGRTVSLEFGAELWKRDSSLYESAEGIRDVLARAGKSTDDDSIVLEATSRLIVDVVDAAGGVEQAYNRLQAAKLEVDEVVSRWSASTSYLNDGTGVVDPSVDRVWYALEELLIWTRTLDERLRRSSFDKRRCPADQGLIPALADGPRRDAVIQARNRLLQGGVGEVRYLSSLNLHMQSSQAGSKIGRMRSGKVFLHFPDRVTQPIGHRLQLTYTEGRDVVSFADSIMVAVERFMDEMILAFETHLPERFKSS